MSNEKPIDLVTGIVVAACGGFALWHRLSNPGLTEIQLLLDAWLIYAGLAMALGGVLAWAKRRG